MIWDTSDHGSSLVADLYRSLPLMPSAPQPLPKRPYRVPGTYIPSLETAYDPMQPKTAYHDGLLNRVLLTVRMGPGLGYWAIVVLGNRDARSVSALLQGVAFQCVNTPHGPHGPHLKVICWALGLQMRREGQSVRLPWLCDYDDFVRVAKAILQHPGRTPKDQEALIRRALNDSIPGGSGT